MSEAFNRNVARLRQLASDRLYQHHRPARLGQYAADGTIDPDLSAGGNYLWVRQGINGERGVTRAINAGVNQAYPDAPVIIAERSTDGSLCIISVDFNEETNAAYGENLLGASIPVIPSITDVQPKDTLLLSAGRVTPSTFYPATLYVYIAPFWHNGRFLGGIHYDVGSGNVPGTAGQYRWAIICVDDDNSASTVTGTASGAVSKDMLLIASAASISIPAGRIPLGLVSLAYGQTDIAESRFEEPRDWLAPRGSLLSEDAETLTLSSDAATAGGGSFFLLAAQSGTTDDCKTITISGVPRVIVVQADSGDTITIKHDGSGGNIKLNGAADYALSGDKTLALFWDGANLSDFGITGGSSPLTTRGDLYYYTTDNARLPIGLDQQFPGYVDGNVAWIYPTAPASLVDPTTTDGDLIYRSVETVTTLGILFIGDSITQSYGVPTDAATALSVNGVTITSYNEGVSATSTDDWGISSSNDTTAYATFTGNAIRVVSIALGVNDARVAVRNDADTYQANLQAIANGWVNRGAIVFLHFPTYCVPGSNSGDQDATANSLRIEYQARILKIVNGTTIRLGDTTGYTLFANDTSLLTDGIHPTATGADRLAAAWARGMQSGVSQLTQVTTLQRLTLGDGLTITGSNPAVLSATATPSPSSDGADHLHGLARWVADGSDTAFDLPDIAEYLEMVFDDGAAVDQLVVALSSNGTQITFDSAPGAASIIQAQYVIAAV